MIGPFSVYCVYPKRRSGEETAMRTRVLKSILAVTVTAGCVAMLFAARSGQSQRLARLDGKPNFSGVWQALNEANWDSSNRMRLALDS